MFKKIAATLISSALIIATVIFGGLYWHNKEMDALAAQMKQEEENRNKLEERMRILSDDNLSMRDKIDALQNSNSSIQNHVEQAVNYIMDQVTETVNTFDAGILEEEIKNISELATINYYYTGVGTLDSSHTFSFIDWTVPFSKKTIVVTMDGIIKAGIDLSKAKIESDESKKTITVSLPKSTILSNELIENSLQVYQEDTPLLNELSVEDTNGLRTQIKEKALQQATNNKIFQLADERAQQLIKSIIESVPNVKGNYNISFKTIS